MRIMHTYIASARRSCATFSIRKMYSGTISRAEREGREYGEYRTRRLVLEAFDKFAESPRFRDELPHRRSAFDLPKAAVEIT